MDKKSKLQVQEYGLKARKVKFFAIHTPSEDFEMQMMIGHSDQIVDQEILFYAFDELEPGMKLPKVEKLRLFETPLTFYESQNSEEQILRFIEKETNLKEVWDYQLRVMNKRPFNQICYYYEEIGKFRKIPSQFNNVFIFTFAVVRNNEYSYYKESQSQPVLRPLSHNLYFMLLFIETKRQDLLRDFIAQYKIFYQDINPDYQEIENFYEIFQKYIEKKPKERITSNFKTLLILVCIFGLLPAFEKRILNSLLRPFTLEILIQSTQSHIEEVAALKKDEVIYQTFVDGMALLAVLEEEKHYTYHWLELLDTKKQSRGFWNDLVPVILNKAEILNVKIKPETFTKIRQVLGGTLLSKINALDFADSLIDLLKHSEDLIRNGFQELKNDNSNHDNLKQEEVKENHELEEIAEEKPLELPKNLSEAQKQVFEKLKKKISESLDKYLKKNPHIAYSATLQTISDFVKELSLVPEYLTDIFVMNEKVCNLVFEILDRLAYFDQKALELIHGILIKYRNHFLLHKIDQPKLLLKIASTPGKAMEFSLKFFSFFMTSADLDLREYAKISEKWFYNLFDLDKLLNNLDDFSQLFNAEDKDAIQKKKMFIEKVIASFKQDELKDKIDIIFRKVKTPEALGLFKDRFTEEIILKNLKYLESKSYNNPLAVLQNLQKKYPQNNIIKELLSFCLLQIPSLTKDKILVNLFEDPNKESLLYMVLTDKVFEKTLIYDEVNKIIVEILKDLKDLNLELKWIFASDALSNKNKQIMQEQLKLIIDLNNLTSEDSKKKLDTIELLQNYKKAFSNKMSLIDKIRDFISSYCLNSNDAQEIVNILTKTKENINKKKMSDIHFPQELQIFVPYAEKLNQFIYSVSFEKFRKQNAGEMEIRNCQEQAKLSEGLLLDFQKELNNLLENENTTVKQFRNFFEDVRDIKKEVQILTNLISQDKSQYLFEMLNFIQDKKTTNNVCQGLKVCIERFNLNCKVLDFIEAGCNLSSKSDAKGFYEANKAINQNIILLKDNEIQKVIIEFKGADELLEFTLARTNKSEIDFMREAVNDYDESHISTQAIFDFTNFWSYITELTQKAKGATLEDFVKEMKVLSEQKIYLGIVDNFKTSKVNSYGIQNLYLELSQKEEAKRKQIFKIIDQSSLRFLKKKHEFDVEVICIMKGVERENIQTFRSSDIFELRDRAHLIVYTEQKKIGSKEVNNYQETELENFKSFCSFADAITQLLSILNKLKFNGYPELFALKVSDPEISIGDADFQCTKGKFYLLGSFKKQLEKVLEEWNHSVLDAYKHYYELTYLKGNDFWKVERALMQPQLNGNVKGLHLLKYIGKQALQSNLNPGKSPQERLNDLGETLKNLPRILKVKKDRKLELDYTFFVAETSEKALLKGLLTLYHTLENEMPLSSQLLICHNSTSWNELVAFAFRCFMSPQDRLFCMVQPERLNFSLQDQFSSLLKGLSNDYPNKKFHLAFVTTNNSIHLITSLKTRNQTKILKSGELLSNDQISKLIREFTQNCRMVTSKIPGLGKTTWIQNYVKQNDQSYHKFPIAGSIDPIMLGKRLLPVLAFEKPALCFTIGSIEEEGKSLLNEILFSLVVLKSFHYSNNVVEISKVSQLLFEIDSSYFENLTEELEILNYLNVEHIDHMRLEELKYDSPKVQFVCHYLKALEYKSLGTQDLIEDDLKNQKLTKEDCLEFLIPKFLENRDKNYISYTQLNIFVDILYSSLKSFSESSFFCYNTLSQTRNQGDNNAVFITEADIIKIRMALVESLILAADQFTSKSVENVRHNQKSSMQVAKDQIIEKANELLGNAVVSWENTRPFGIVFTLDNSPIFIYKTLTDVPQAVRDSIQHQIAAFQALNGNIPVENPLKEYRNCAQKDLFEKLASLTTTLYNRNICLKCYRKYDREMPNCLFCEIPLLKNTDSNSFIEKIAAECAKDYALTPDNFIKMLLVFIRVQRKIPVIIMGETGCGKTSLIRYLCSRVLDDEFHIFSIHAGITEDVIIKEMEQFIDQANTLQFEEKKLWIFFDEFNTTASIGIIKEILCERTMLGQSLPENMVFLGACNPWRLKTQQIIFDENVGIKKDKISQINSNYNLLYTVYPLPETMIDYVWDYGHLDTETEKKYIDAMFSSLVIANDFLLKEIMIDLVCAAHQMFRKWEDVSSVSLRDVARYKILFNWFLNSFTERSKLTHKNKLKKYTKTLQHRAALLALLHCYYLRISSKRRRTELLSHLKPLLNKLFVEDLNVEELLFEEEMDFLKRMEPLPEGIAENEALRENVFALIVCIFTKIPLFICGKPGCSKSLAVQLVFDNLRGKNSRDDYFRTLPELIPVSYQGSEYCTSESIIGVFNRAEKYLNVNTQNKEILPVIIFDEIGLAEISKNNPLKVLHNKLEIENIKVAFVGISNWRLDASKMNRALYLARPDPGIEDLKFTAEAIYKSIAKNNNSNHKIIETLARIYCDLREELKEKRKEDIFGLRDYYFLIKGFSIDLVNRDKDEIIIVDIDHEESLFTIIRKNLKKNFSGLGNEHEFLWKRFCQYMGMPEKELQIREPSARELILNNLSDKNSRYLMLITQSDCVSEYIEEIIQNKGKQEEDTPEGVYEEARKLKTLVGSHMPEDLSKQSYGFRILSDIILYIEKGYTLVFKKIDHIYSSLYDLFNQNFSWSGDKKYCRIALGALYNPKCLVHQDFHCVIFISESEVEKADPPFLNRFEKYRLRVEDILSENERMLQFELVKWVKSIVSWEDEPDLIRPELVFANYNTEYLFSLILKVKKTFQNQNELHDDNSILDICKKELIKVASFDFAILVSLNVKEDEAKKELLDYYYKIKLESFKMFCQRIVLDTQNISKSVIYTYSQISDDIAYPEKALVKELKLGSFKSEMEVLEEVYKYFDSDRNLLVIRIELAKESRHLLLMKHLLLNTLNAYKHVKGQHLMVIIHLQRFNAGNIVNDTLFQEWESFMFDDLNKQYVVPLEYLEKPSFSKLGESELMFPLEKKIGELFDRCLSKFRYNIENGKDFQINERRNDILAQLKNENHLLLKLIPKVVKGLITKDLRNQRFRDWRKYIVLEEWIRADSNSPIEALNIALLKFYEGYVMKVLHKFEKDYLLDSILAAIRNDEKELVDIWCENFESLKIDQSERLDDQAVEIKFIFGLYFPFSSFEEVVISGIQEKVDEVGKHENQNLTNMIVFEKFLETSFFGEKFYTTIFDKENEKLFSKYFSDQLLLFITKNKIDVPVKMIDLLLDHMSINDNKVKFQYFLTNTQEFKLLLGVVEALLKLQQGHDILIKSFQGFYNLDSEDLRNIKTEGLPKYILLFKRGEFYNMDRTEFEGFLSEPEQNDLSNYEKDDSNCAFLYFFFKNIIAEISSCNFLSQFKTISEVKSAFKSIEEKIIKTKILPSNLEAFRPWIDLMQFIETCDNVPNTRFLAMVESLKQFEEDGVFTLTKSVTNLIDYLKKEIVFVDSLNKHEKQQKIAKLQTQLYKNLVAVYEDEFFIDIIAMVDEDSELWRNSGKIIDLLDDYTAFSNSIMEENGLIRDIANNSGLPLLEDILQKSSEKIALLLANKAFIDIEASWLDNFKTVLEDQFQNFKQNMLYFQKHAKQFAGKQWNTVSCVSFLAVMVWIKAYLYFYSIAIERDEKDIEVLKDINQIFAETTPELSTLKLFILKNLKINNNKTFGELRKEYKERNIDWMKPLIKENPNKISDQDLIVPLPLYQASQFKTIDSMLNDMYNLNFGLMDKFVALCVESQKDYNFLICVYSWFVRLYTNHLQKNYAVEPDFLKLIQDSRQKLSDSLGDNGYQYILLLITNFKKESFFYLKEGMTADEINQRLVALNVVMSFLAQEFTDSAFSSFLYKENQFQKNLSEHFSKISLFGQLENDFIINNMKDVKANIERRLQQNLIIADAKFIFKCSERCDYLYYFEGCGRPVEKSICKVCGSEIGASSYNVLLTRNNGLEQLKMPIPEGLNYINNYIQKFETRDKKGYLINPLGENSKLDTKQDLKPITFRTLHFLLHTTIFGLMEIGFVSNKEIDRLFGEGQNIASQEYFKGHFLQDYKMITELLGNNEQHIWIYQMISNFEALARDKGTITDSKMLYKLEKNFEDSVILPIIQSTSNTILKYRQTYLEYTKTKAEEEDISSYVEELKLNPEKYPCLEFFNYMNFPSFDDFSNQFSLLIGNGKVYPLLDFTLKRHQELQNISSLPVIVDFTNYLMKKFNYRISRDQATTMKILDLFEEDDSMKKKFSEFEEKWNQLNLQTVRVQCQEKKFQKVNAENNLCLFLPNTHKDESGILLVGTMIATANLQNEFIYTAKRANNSTVPLETIIQEERANMEIIQTIKSDQIIHINRKLIMIDIIKSGYIHNYEYGKSREIIYDFEEIESKLHQYVNGKKALNEEKFIFMNYQFELYPEGASIFTDIRKKNPQESLSPEAKAKYRNLLRQFSKKDMLSYLGSLDYVFTYLMNIKEDGNKSIEDFTKGCIQNYHHLNEHVIRRQPLSTVPLKYVIDLYETLEEVIFDEAIQDFIRPEFLEKIPEEEKAYIVEMFDKVTIGSKDQMLYPKLKEPATLAKVFKRLILRVLLAQVNLENRLFDYFAREDMWEQDVDINEIYNIELSEEIKLKHCYIILKHLESKLNLFEPVQVQAEEVRPLDQKVFDEYHQVNRGIQDTKPKNAKNNPQDKKRNRKIN